MVTPIQKQQGIEAFYQGRAKSITKGAVLLCEVLASVSCEILTIFCNGVK
jgi:hypothetical protein